ncbi:hypothetical protein QQ056_07135 [Oscillatoria laete-virens NRMC-F 0139]|nr:hypothetical protein [Oscillatoria laete-virens]MDL5053318.1 hypothetical protein [Oscillatoria laete-virens NRMC-F 0139]
MNGPKLSLYQDWVQRRQELDQVPDSPVHGYRAAHIRILDYLVSRYAEDPRAQTPALFPKKSGLVMNQRATLIHTHLLGRPTTQNMDDAIDRMSPILKRMAAQKAQESVAAPAEGKAATVPNLINALTGLPISAIFSSHGSAAVNKAWEYLEKAPTLPNEVVQTLCKNLYDRRVTPILKRCHNQSAVVYCGEAWLLGENVAAAEAVLIEPHHQPVALGFMREKLAHHHSLTRGAQRG